MRLLKCTILLLFFVVGGAAQETIDSALDRYNEESIRYISVEELRNAKNVFLLDTRTKEEFEVSHLEEAVWVGHMAFSLDSVLSRFTDKNTAVVVYCSIGVRSEDIGEKLKSAGFNNVKNLYGGIFKWKNKGYPVFNSQGVQTDEVHAYSKQWGKLLTNADKVYKLKKKANKEKVKG